MVFLWFQPQKSPRLIKDSNFPSRSSRNCRSVSERRRPTSRPDISLVSAPWLENPRFLNGSFNKKIIKKWWIFQDAIFFHCQRVNANEIEWNEARNSYEDMLNAIGNCREWRNAPITRMMTCHDMGIVQSDAQKKEISRSNDSPKTGRSEPKSPLCQSETQGTPSLETQSCVQWQGRNPNWRYLPNKAYIRPM